MVQKFARGAGIKFETMRLKKEEEDQPALTEETVRELVLDWRNKLSGGLAQHLQTPLEWDESSSAPYFTDKPAWDCYGAVLLLAAYNEHDKSPLPSVVPEHWEQDSVVRASLADDFQSAYSHLMGPEVWLPNDFKFTFKSELVTAKEVSIGSSRSLLSQLWNLNDRTLHGTRENFVKWRNDGAEYGGPFEQSAKMGLAVLITLAEESVKNNLPMLLDY